MAGVDPVYVCTQCAGRQDEDARCAGCGWDTVHDLRSGRTRDFLDEIESRLRDQREGRIRAIAVIAGMIVVFALWLIPGYWSLRGRLYPGLPLLADQIALMIAIALGARHLLEKALERPRFPFLKDLPPPDRE